ncbi:hypothetical protein RI367_001891 [Sorochytrium milnesiophthora]
MASTSANPDQQGRSRHSRTQTAPLFTRVAEMAIKAANMNIKEDDAEGNGQELDSLKGYPSDARENGYLPIENYGIIGNMRTAALVGMDASVDFMCFPKFDSPSLFCRLLDKDIGGHYQIAPLHRTSRKQQYLPNSNLLTTRFLSEEGASQVTDFFHLPDGSTAPPPGMAELSPDGQTAPYKPLYQWLIRTVEMVRGVSSFRIECFPAFNYGLDSHTAEIKAPKPSESLQYYLTDTPTSFLGRTAAHFKSSSGLEIDLRYVISCGDCETCPRVSWKTEQRPGMKGPGVVGTFDLLEGQQVWFVLREVPKFEDAGPAAATGVTSPILKTGSETMSPLVQEHKDSHDIMSGCESKLETPSQPGSVSGMSNSLTDGEKEGGGSPEFDRREVQSNGVTMHQQRLPSASMSGDRVSYFSRKWSKSAVDPPLSLNLLHSLYKQTLNYWHTWIGQATYTGRWRETVQRSALTLKLLTYEPTGAVIAALTFSLPEGTEFFMAQSVWIRDSAFTIYALIRVGLIQEARSYLRFIELVCRDRNEDGSLKVMYTIDGGKDIPEIELTHLEGYKGSKPVRIGNGAASHLQLDIYGALLDAIYLMNKFSSPVGYDMWLFCRSMVNYVCANWNRVDMSIWEVRGRMMNFVYSKVMCWVAVDRGLRLADRRVFPCPDRAKWLETRDVIYEEIMNLGWDAESKTFVQSYENHVLDSSVLIMPLVFFISPTDSRLVSTINAILRPPEKQGGLTSNNLVHRYNHLQVDDGLKSKEGAFTMCTFWLVEALTRAGKYNHRPFLDKALLIFEQLLGYGNHIGLFSEEVASSGELLGNFPQAFTHIALISAAFNLDRVMSGKNLSDD